MNFGVVHFMKTFFGPTNKFWDKEGSSLQLELETLTLHCCLNEIGILLLGRRRSARKSYILGFNSTIIGSQSWITTLESPSWRYQGSLIACNVISSRRIAAQYLVAADFQHRFGCNPVMCIIFEPSLWPIGYGGEVQQRGNNLWFIFHQLQS